MEWESFEYVIQTHTGFSDNSLSVLESLLGYISRAPESIKLAITESFLQIQNLSDGRDRTQNLPVNFGTIF